MEDMVTRPADPGKFAISKQLFLEPCGPADMEMES